METKLEKDKRIDYELERKERMNILETIYASQGGCPENHIKNHFNMVVSLLEKTTAKEEKDPQEEVMAGAESIHVYPKGEVFCPKNQCKQHQDACSICSNYKGHRINTDRFYIACDFNFKE